MCFFCALQFQYHKQKKEAMIKTIKKTTQTKAKQDKTFVNENQVQTTEEVEFENKEKIKKALLKRATGYTHNEVVEEYVCLEDGEVKLAKRKVTKKFVPPDIPAVKLLMQEFDKTLDFSALTDGELLEEKERLLKELACLEEDEWLFCLFKRRINGNC